MPRGDTPRPFPLYPLVGAGSLVLLTLLSVAWIRWFGETAPDSALADPVVMGRDLRFVDLADGSVDVLEDRTSRLLRRLEVGEDGFVRATVRGLVRARRARGEGAAQPFRLELRTSGQLLLQDPVTGQSIDLWAFGATNARAFASMLDMNGQRLASAPSTAAKGKP
jgi:putative photosynthetic complex assembly protein